MTEKIKAPFDLEQTLFWKILYKSIRILLVITGFMTMALIITGVYYRYILKTNFFGGEEVIIAFAFWLYFVGAMHGSCERSHIKADMIKNYVKNVRVRDGITIVASLIACIVCLAFTKWGLDYVLWDLKMMPRSTALKIPMLVPHSAIFIGYVLMTFYNIYYLQKNARAYFSKSYTGAEPLRG